MNITQARMLRFGDKAKAAGLTQIQQDVATNFDAIADQVNWDVAAVYLSTRYGGTADPTVMFNTLGISNSGGLQNIYRGAAAASSTEGQSWGFPTEWHPPIAQVGQDGKNLIYANFGDAAKRTFALPVVDKTKPAVR